MPPKAYRRVLGTWAFGGMERMRKHGAPGGAAQKLSAFEAPRSALKKKDYKKPAAFYNPFKKPFLKIGGFGSSGERDNVAQVCHAGYVAKEAFKTETEARMDDGAVFAQIEVPPIVFGF